MFGSAARFLPLAVLAFSLQSFAQPVINNGDSTWRVGRVDWELQASGGTGTGYVWSLDSGTLPPGLAIRTDTPPGFTGGVTAGLIGVATTPGTYPLTLRVTDSGSNIATKLVTVKILGLVITSDWEFGDASVGVPYSKTITTAGASGSVSFALTAGSSLPLGLSLNPSTGEISGTPTTAGNYDFGVEIVDSTGSLYPGLRIYVSPMSLTSPATLANGTQGTPYSHAITVAGGTGPFTYSLNCCTPGWLSLNSSTGVLSGTPDGPGFWSFWVDIADSTGAHLRKHYQLGVVGTPPVLTGLTTDTIEDLTIGEYSVWHLGITGGTPPYTFTTSGTLPPGLTVQNVPDPRPFWTVPGAWLIGAPITLGTYTFTVTATDSSAPAVSTSREYTVRVSPLSFDGLPNADFGVAYSQRIRILGGQQPYAVVKTLGSLPSGLTMDGTGLISGTPTESGNFWIQFQVTDNAAGTYTHGLNLYVQTTSPSWVDIQSGGWHTLVNQYFNWSLWAWGGSGTYNWQLEPLSSLPAGVSLSGSPGSFVVLSGTPPAAGNYSFTLRATDVANSAIFAVRTFRMTVTPLNLVVNGTLPWGNANSAYSTNLAVSGATGTVTWTIDPGSSLPGGMSLSSGGVLSGTPSSPGQYWLQLRATDSGTGTSASWGFQVSLYPAGQTPPLVITNGDAEFQIGLVDWQLQTEGGTGTGHAWSVVSGTLPPGFVLRTDTPSWYNPGATAGLAGVATTPGIYSLTVQVTDSGGKTATKALTVRILPIVVVSNWELPDATLNVSYVQDILATYGCASQTFTLRSGSLLPPGLELRPGGRIMGTPTVEGTYNFDVLITDGCSTTGQRFRIYVSPLTISTPVTLPNATQGAPYSQTIAVSGGTGGPYTFGWGCCAPGGLSLDPNTGVLSGTLNDPGYYSIEVQVNDSNGKWARRVFRLGVVGTPAVLPGITTTNLEDFAVGSQTWTTVGLSGGTAPYSWSLTSGSLPPGIVMDSPTVAPPWGGWRAGLILGGTPRQAGVYTFTLQVTDSSLPAPRSTSREFTWRISPVYFGGVPNATFASGYNQQLRVYGGPLPYAVSVVRGDVPEGLSVSPTGLISGTPRETGNFWFQLRAAGSAGEYTHGINLYVAGPSATQVDINNGRLLGDITLNAPWSFQFNAGGGTTPYTWTSESGSALPAGLSLSSDGLLSGTPTSAGVQSFLVRVTDKNGNFAVRKFQVNVTPVNVNTSGDLTYVNVGSAYNRALSASGGTGSITWSVAPDSVLPPGMTLDSDGTLHGTPSVTGQFWFNLKATDSAGAIRTQNFSLSVYPVGEAPPVVINMSDFTVPVGRLDWRLEVSGGTGTGYTWTKTSGTLPPGLAILSDTPTWVDPTGMARLAGVATTPGTYNFTLQVTDSGGHSTTKALTAKVLGLVMTSDSELADASVGVSYSKTITTAGASGTVSFPLSPGSSLPPGLNLNSSTGVISGTPTAAGNYNFNIDITDSAGRLNYGIHVNVSPMRLTSAASLPNATQGTPYSHTITVAGGTGSLNYSLNCCSPGWLSLNSSTGALSGTPNGPGLWGFTVVVNDSAGNTLRKHYQLGVVATPPGLPGLTTVTIEDFTLGQFLTWNLGISGGTPPYTWSVTAGSLPPGVTVQNPADPSPYASIPGAWLMGTPTTVGTYTFTVTPADSSVPPVSTSREYTVHVSPLSFDQPPNPEFGVAYSQRFRILGGQQPYAVVKTLGSLHSGLTMDGTGLISGTPAETGTLWLQIQVTDAAANTYTHGLNFYVQTTPPTAVDIQNGGLGHTLVNQNFNWHLSAWGGSGTYNWALEPLSSLPAGVSLSGSPGPFAVLSGTPTAVGDYTFTLRAIDTANSSNFGVRTFRMTVTPLNLVVNGTLPWGNAGTSYSTNLAVSGATGTVTWTIDPGSSLPGGMSLSSGGVLSGTPSSPGQYWLQLRATDSGTGTSASWGFQVALYPAGASPPVSISTGSGLGTLSIGPMQQELSAQGGNGVYTWSQVDGTLPPGVLLRTDKPSWFSSQASAGLIGLATTPGTYNFTLRVTSGAQTLDKAFTVKIVGLVIKDPSGLPDAFKDQSYSYTFSNTGPEAVTWALQPGNPLPPGMTLTSGGVLSGPPTTAGSYNFSVAMSDGADTVSRGFGITVHAIRVTSGRRLPNATQNTPYTFNFAALGTVGAVTWNADSTPPGLTLLQDGTLSGTPNHAGSWWFGVTVTDSTAQFFKAWYHLTVVGVPPILPTINTMHGLLNDLSLGVEAVIGFSASGGTAPYTWSASGLPPGMSLRFPAELYTNLDPAGGIIWGTPTALGTYPVTISATENAGSGVTTSRIYTLKVTAMSHESDVIPYGYRGESFQATLRTIGGAYPYVWSLASGVLPYDLSLSATGVVSGMPLENLRPCPRILVTDSAAKTFETTYCFDIGARTTTININTGYDRGSRTLGLNFSQTLSAGGAPSYVWSVESGSTLPDGVSLSTDGVLSGTPTTKGSYTFLIRAADSANLPNFGVKRFVLNVTPLVVTSTTNLGWTNVGASPSYTPVVTGNVGGVTWSVAVGSSVPPGMTLNTSTGALTGTPASAGNYSFSLVLTDTAGATSRTVGFSISIYPAGINPPLYLGLGPNIGPLAVGSLTSKLSATGGYPPYTYSYSATPITGMRVQNGPPLPSNWASPLGGFLGVLTTPGTYNTTIRVTDSQVQTFDRAITVNVSPLMPLSQDWLPRATVGSSYSFTFTAAGGTPPYQWSVPSGSSLPPGFSSLTTGGLLSGSPSTAGTYNFRLRLTDGGSNYIEWNFNLEVMPFAITTAGVLPQGTVNSPYPGVTLAANASGVTWSMDSGGLPGGLTLDQTTGAISGTPTSATYRSFTIRATSAGQSSLKNFSLVVLNASPGALSITSSSPLPDNVVGRTYQFQLYASGGAPSYSWDLAPGSDPLPPGLELVNQGETVCNSCAAGFAYITGRPRTVGDYTFTLRVTDTASPTPNSVTKIFTMHVAPVSIEYENLPISSTTLVYNTAYSQAMLGIGGTGSYTWAVEGAMPPGLSLSAAGLISGKPANTGSFSTPVRITDGAGATILRTVYFFVDSGTALTLNINPGADLGTVALGSSGGSYALNLSASGSSNYTFSAVGALPAGCALQTGDALPSGATNPARMACNLLSSGLLNFTFKVEDPAGNFAVKTFLLRVTPNFFFTGSNSLYNAATGVDFSQRLIAWGAAQTWSLASGALPAGLTLDSNGTLHGTPSAIGPYSFTASLTDGSGFTMTRNYNMNVASLAITDPAIIPTHAIRGEPFTYTFTATGGGSKTWSTPGSLPLGITLSSAGVLSGTTAMEGNYTFSLRVSDGLTTFAKLVTLVVRNKYAVVTSSFTPLPVFLAEIPVGLSFSYTLTTTGGVPPYTWSVKSGSSLPPGLTLLSGANLPADTEPIRTLLAGAPSTAGQYNFTLLLTDARGVTVERAVSLKVSSLSLIALTPRNATRNSLYNQALTAVGGAPPYTFTLASGPLPVNMTLTSAGVITGTTTDTGNWSITVRVADSAGNSFSRSYNLFVNAENATQPQTPRIGFGPVLPDVSVGRGVNWSLFVGGGSSPYTWDHVSGTLPPGLTLKPCSSDPSQPCLNGRATTPGVYTFTLSVKDNGGRFGYKTLTQRVSALQTLPDHDLYSVAGTPANIQLRAAGGTPPHSFALAPNSTVPPGLTLNSNGTITGTTPESGAYSFGVTVSDSAAGSITESYNLTVWPVGIPVPMVLDSDDGIHLGGEVGGSFVNTARFVLIDIEPTNPPLSLTVTSGSLPPGIQLISGTASHNAYLLGAPTLAGDYNYSLSLADGAGQSLTAVLTQTVSPASLNVSPDTLPLATVGIPYSATFVPTGGTAPYQVYIPADSDFPPGLTLSGMTLAGTPSFSGRFSITLTLLDLTGKQLTRRYEFYVDSAATPVRALNTSPGTVRVMLVSGSTPAPVPITISSGAASVNFTAAVAGIPGASLSVTSGATPQAISLLLPSLGIGTYYGVIEVNAPQAPTTVLVVPVIVNVVAPPPCGYAISPATASIAAAGGPGSVNVSTQSYCDWSASTSQPTWVTFTSSTSGTGSGSVSYSLSSNPGTSPRTATVSVNGQTHTITQFGSSCSFTIDPSGVSVPAAGGDGVIAVNSSLAGCTWTATSNDPALVQVTSGSSGTGSGNVGIHVNANGGASSRSGTVTVAGLTYTVNQADAGCIVSLSSGGAELSANGGAGSVNVTTNGCAYSTMEGPAWITVSSGGSGSGSGTLNYSVAPNSSTQTRAGSLLIGGQPYQIAEAGMACSFTITSNNPVFGSSGGSGSILVEPNGSNCGWTASSGSSVWLPVTSGSSGMGSGQVSFNVGSSSSPSARAGSIVVAGQTVTVNQSGITCSYDLRSTSGNVPATGGTATAGVISAGACTWNASSNIAWLSIASAAGSGTGDVVYAAQPNPTSLERNGTLTIAGQTYTVTQPGAPCAYTISGPASTIIGPGGATSSFGFTANQTGCTPAAVSLANWIAVSTTFSGTSGTVNFTVAANSLAAARGGAIQLGDQVFTVSQTAAACAFSLNAFGAVYNNAGGSGDVLTSATALGCSPAVGASPELTLGPLTSDPVTRIWTQPYTVPEYHSIQLWIRLLNISISGEIFAIKQTSW